MLRQGRLTPGQARALELHWPAFGREIDDGMLNPRAQFLGSGPLHLEIGFGMGDSLAEQARSNPSVNYVKFDEESHHGDLKVLLELTLSATLSRYMNRCFIRLVGATNVQPEGMLQVSRLWGSLDDMCASFARTARRAGLRRLPIF